jgi:hypothetical protein
LADDTACILYASSGRSNTKFGIMNARCDCEDEWAGMILEAPISPNIA